MNAQIVGLCVAAFVFTSSVNAKDATPTLPLETEQVTPTLVDSNGGVSQPTSIEGSNQESSNQEGNTDSLLASLKNKQTKSPSTVSDNAVGKMFFGLSAILLLIFAFSWVLKRLNINKLGVASNLSVSGVLPIGTKEKIVVVNVEGTRLVLGVTATSITKLHTLDSTEPSATPSLTSDSPLADSVETSASTGGQSFAENMKKIIKEGLRSD